jgi:glycosyltransferase involved in cell wall biosynthesis
VLTPYIVDNDWWTSQAAQVDTLQVRAAWGIPTDDTVVLFCAKLQPWKRPQDLLHAFAQANVPKSWLVYAGDGAIRKELEQTAHELGIADHVRFLGFVNQSKLPAVYATSDLLVFPSEYEPFGVVVNESMLCGHPVVVSDQVGAQVLVQPGETGFIYPCGDVEQLTTILQEILPDKERLQCMGAMARKHMDTWSPKENVAATFQAIEKAVNYKRG